MAKADELTFSEFLAINNRLRLISDTWSDLWITIYYSQVSIGKLLALRFDDFSEINLLLKKAESTQFLMGHPLQKIIQKRRNLYPNDIFLFQSHSNRVKFTAKPVTVVAFNQALRNCAVYVTEKNVSSSSARRVKIIRKIAA